MYSVFNTPHRQYKLKTNVFVCNKFGLAEFFSKHYVNFGDSRRINVLDVGCGVLPLGIFLADQKQCNITGVELNPIAYRCAKQNIIELQLAESINLINANFEKFIKGYKGHKFDLIISNPPIEKPAIEQIAKYSNFLFETLDDESYSYLTNSWHSAEGKDLLDYIFEFSSTILKPNGRIIIVFCNIGCTSNDYVFDKARKHNYESFKTITGEISSKSIGFRSLETKIISAYMVDFRKYQNYDSGKKSIRK